MKRTVATLTLCAFMSVLAGTSLAGADRRLVPRPVAIAEYAKSSPTVLTVSAADLPDQLDLTSFALAAVVGGAVLLGAAVAVAATEWYHHHTGQIQEQPIVERLTGGTQLDVLFDAQAVR